MNGIDRSSVYFMTRLDSMAMNGKAFDALSNKYILN